MRRRRRRIIHEKDLVRDGSLWVALSVEKLAGIASLLPDDQQLNEISFGAIFNVSHIVDLNMQIQMQPLYRSFLFATQPIHHTGPPNSCIPYTRTLNPHTSIPMPTQPDAPPLLQSQQIVTHSFLGVFIRSVRPDQSVGGDAFECDRRFAARTGPELRCLT